MAPTGRYKWIMGNEERVKAVRCGRIIQQWILGLEDGDKDYDTNLKNQWKNFLIPALSDEIVDELWQQVKDRKSAMSW